MNNFSPVQGQMANHSQNLFDKEFFFCDKCRTRDKNIVVDKRTVDFSEAKEEETDCYYC